MSRDTIVLARSSLGLGMSVLIFLGILLHQLHASINYRSNISSMALHLQILYILEVNLVKEHLVQDDAKVGDKQISVLKLNRGALKTLPQLFHVR